jgi:hypothetical protein
VQRCARLVTDRVSNRRREAGFAEQGDVHVLTWVDDFLKFLHQHEVDGISFGTVVGHEFNDATQ